MHAILAEHGAYRIPKEKFVWYGDNPDAESTGADAPGLKADPKRAAPRESEFALPSFLARGNFSAQTRQLDHKLGYAGACFAGGGSHRVPDT